MRGAHLVGLGPLVAEAAAGGAPQPPRGDRGQQPGEVVAPDGGVGAAAQRERGGGEGDPCQRLADPVHPQRGRHRLEPAGGAQVDVGGGRHRDRCRRDRDLRRPGRERHRRDQDRRRHADAEGDAGAAVDQAAQRRHAAGALADGDVANGRQIHAEAAAGGGHEPDLDSHRDQAQPGAAELAAHQHLHAEGGGDARSQPDDVEGGAGQQRAMVTHALARSVSHRSAVGRATRGSRGRAAAPRPRAPRRPRTLAAAAAIRRSRRLCRRGLDAERGGDPAGEVGQRDLGPVAGADVGAGGHVDALGAVVARQPVGPLDGLAGVGEAVERSRLQQQVRRAVEVGAVQHVLLAQDVGDRVCRRWPGR